MSAASNVFRDMFNFHKQQRKALKAIGKNADATIKTPIVVDDVEVEAFRVMLNYIYSDEINELNNDNVFDVIKAGKI